MAFDFHSTKFLLEARARGVSFERFCMIGRQSLRIDAGPLRRLLGRAGIALSRAQIQRLFTEADGFAEPLLRLLGAKELESLDASAYEAASIVHDMNLPVPERLKNRFTAVVDGGSLEHVFNLPCAIRNCMDMVAVGGHYLGISPGNNWMGHGFYQFSPELFFRVLVPANGFERPSVIVCEAPAGAPWYEVMDPSAVARRVKLTNRRPAILLTRARKTREVPESFAVPQQSDYSAKWRADQPAQTRRKLLPLRVREFFRRLRAWFKSPFSSKSYRRLPN